MKIRKNDQVQVISGSDKGKRGKVIRIFSEKESILVEGINYVYKHMKKSQQYPKGGRIQKEAAVPISNVMLICEKCQKPVRVRYQKEKTGKKRICAKCSNPF